MYSWLLILDIYYGKYLQSIKSDSSLIWTSIKTISLINNTFSHALVMYLFLFNRGIETVLSI